MSSPSIEIVLRVEVERLRQENERITAENNALRPMVSDLTHKLAVATHRCERCPGRHLMEKS